LVKKTKVFVEVIAVKKIIQLFIILCLVCFILLTLEGCDLIGETDPRFLRKTTQSSGASQSPTHNPTDPGTNSIPVKTPTAVYSPTITIPEVHIPRSALSTEPFLRGMNIGNALEAPEPGIWGVTIQKSYLETIAEAGFNAVRIPARFSSHTGLPPDYSIDPAFLNTVDEVIHWGLDAGLIVILDFHGFTELMFNPTENENQFLKIWEQLSEHYQSYPDSLWFELINEPSENLNADHWNDLIEKSLQTIRQTNPQRKVLVGGVNYSTMDTLYLLDLPTDPNLIGVFHFYDPFDFTHQGAEWWKGRVTGWEPPGKGLSLKKMQSARL
jgi:aryl-phospho-beta-D-glucosidase BglC (GH1 family)